MGWFGGEPETNTSATIDMSKYSTGSNFKYYDYKIIIN